MIIKNIADYLINLTCRDIKPDIYSVFDSSCESSCGDNVNSEKLTILEILNAIGCRLKNLFGFVKINTTTETIEDGEAVVNVSGDVDNLNFDFKIPNIGKTGPAGPQGEPGPAGPQGPQGPQGEPGEIPEDYPQIRKDVSILKEDIKYKITKFYASNEGKTNVADSDNGKIIDMMIYGKSSQDGTPSPKNPVEIKSVVNPVLKVMGNNLLSELNVNMAAKNGITVTPSTQEKLVIKGTATSDTLFDFWGQNFKVPKQANLLCKILKGTGTNNNAITFFGPNYTGGLNTKFGEVSSRPAPTDYPCKMMRISIPRGESIDCTIGLSLQMNESTAYEPYTVQALTLPYTLNAIPVSSGGNITIDGQRYVADYVDAEIGKLIKMVDSNKLDSSQSIIDKTDWLLATPTESILTAAEIAAFKSLTTYYPVTNVSTTSDQLDGYTVFNYPISLANGWNYVKQQIGDNREYIYDIDLQSAEAYVNSEYAVALTELEV